MAWCDTCKVVTQNIYLHRGAVHPDVCSECGKATVDIEKPPCIECGRSDGPYPKGDRPKSSNPLQSGCPRCGWCY